MENLLLIVGLLYSIGVGFFAVVKARNPFEKERKPEADTGLHQLYFPDQGS